MTNSERICVMYDLILSLVTSNKNVTVRTKFFSVDFCKKNNMYCMRTEKVTASSEYLHPLYELVRSTLADKSLCEDIEILENNKVFAVIKD